MRLDVAVEDDGLLPAASSTVDVTACLAVLQRGGVELDRAVDRERAGLRRPNSYGSSFAGSTSAHVCPARRRRVARPRRHRRRAQRGTRPHPGRSHGTTGRRPRAPGSRPPTPRRSPSPPAPSRPSSPISARGIVTWPGTGRSQAAHQGPAAQPHAEQNPTQTHLRQRRREIAPAVSPSNGGKLNSSWFWRGHRRHAMRRSTYGRPSALATTGQPSLNARPEVNRELNRASAGAAKVQLSHRPARNRQTGCHRNASSNPWSLRRSSSLVPSSSPDPAALAELVQPSMPVQRAAGGFAGVDGVGAGEARWAGEDVACDGSRIAMDGMSREAARCVRDVASSATS